MFGSFNPKKAARNRKRLELAAAIRAHTGHDINCYGCALAVKRLLEDQDTKDIHCKKCGRRWSGVRSETTPTFDGPAPAITERQTNILEKYGDKIRKLLSKNRGDRIRIRFYSPAEAAQLEQDGNAVLLDVVDTQQARKNWKPSQDTNSRSNLNEKQHDEGPSQERTVAAIVLG